MDVKHYIFTRWSLYDPERFASFHIGKNSSSDEEFKKMLFNESRLRTRFEFFEKMTYPSVINQTYKNYEWRIYTSVFLPQEYKDRLNKLQTDYIKVIYLKPGQLVEDTDVTIKGQKNFTTMKLDDDDGLAPTFLEKLNLYTSQTGKIITFPFGILYTIVDGKVVLGGKHEFRNINLGITAIGFNIFRTGNHFTVDERFDVIVDNTPDMYWLCCSDVCDTKRKFSYINTAIKRQSH